MKLKNKGWLIWIVLAYLLCLLPSGCFSWISSLISSRAGDGSALSHAGGWMELAAHAILMGGVAYCLFRLINSILEWLPSLLLVLFVVLLVAVSIEWIQGLLPPEFHRGPSMSDIWASLVGAVVGGIAALLFKRPAGQAG